MLKTDNLSSTLLKFFILTAICQLTDYMAVNFFHIITNNRMIFGLISNNGLAATISLLAAIIFIFAISFFVAPSKLLVTVFAAGALSNFLARFIWGGIPDYFHFLGLFSYNLADVFIVVSVILIGWFYISPTKNTS